MKFARYFSVLLILGFVFNCHALSLADETMPSDDMGNGAEYEDTSDRATQIDEAGDGDYNAGDGSVIEGAGSDNMDSGSDDQDQGTDNMDTDSGN